MFFTGQIDSGPIRGTISYVPQSTGDSWVIVEPDGGIVHVQLFDFMRVTSRKANNRVERTLNPLLAKMTEDQLRFSYRAVLHVVARRQLNIPVDGNLATILVGIQADVDAAKADIQANARGDSVPPQEKPHEQN